MKLRNLLLLLFIASNVYAQQQKIEGNGKIIEFSAPYSKIKVKMNKDIYKDVSELPINADTRILDDNGDTIKPEEFAVGEEIEIVAEKANYKWRLISIKKISEAARLVSEAGATLGEKGDGTFFTRNGVLSIGRGIGSSLGRKITYDKSKLSWTFIWENKQRFELLDKYGFLTKGGYIGWKTYREGYNKKTDEYDQNWTYIVVGGRTAFHLVKFKKIKRWDPYAGLMLSLNLRLYKGLYSSTDNLITIKPTIFLGSRFYIIKNLAAYAEFGYGISYFNFGIAWNVR